MQTERRSTYIVLASNAKMLLYLRMQKKSVLIWFTAVFVKDYLIWMKHGEGSSAPSAEANLVHADGLNMDDGT